MMRSWAGWYAAALAACHQHGQPRPSLVVLDCKGGPDARAKAARTRLLHAVGASQVAVWPDETPISLWSLPARDLAVTLFEMVETGAGPAAYYADVMQAVLTLAVTAPPGSSANGSEFLQRLEPGWLDVGTRTTRPPGRLAGLDPGAPAVQALRTRHLRVFGELETERDDIHRKLAALAKETSEHGGDPALLDALPLLGDVLPQLPERIKQKLFEAFDLAMLYSKKHNQVTCWATITPATPATLAAILAEAGSATWPPTSQTMITFRIWHGDLEAPDCHERGGVQGVRAPSCLSSHSFRSRP